MFDRDLRPHLEGVALPADVMQKAFAQKDLNGLPLYDQKSSPPVWFGTALSSFGIVYNRDVLAYLGLLEPKTWSDLRDPRYRNWLVLADPTRSRAAQTAFMLIVERAMADAAESGRFSVDQGWARGMGTIRQIAWNARMFTDNGSGVPAIVANGEAAAGMAIDFQARAEVDAVQRGETSRLGYVEPAGATAYNADPVALVKGAQHREIAMHFIEFLLSDEGQRLWNTRAGAPGGPKHASLRRLPIMKSVYDRPLDFTDAVNPYIASGTFNTSRSRTATSPIVGDLIYMSCIATHDDLRRVPAGKLDKLGVFPFDQKEALTRAKRWASATPADRLSLQREWTEDFRDEYRNLARD